MQSGNDLSSFRLLFGSQVRLPDESGEESARPFCFGTAGFVVLGPSG
jgi:hypothetical protein